MGNECSGCVPDKADKPGFLREYDNVNVSPFNFQLNLKNNHEFV